MKRIKAFTIVSIVFSMGLIACGNKPVKESSVLPIPSSEIPSSIITPSSEPSLPELSSQSIFESASEALSSLINSSSSTSSSEIEEPPSSPLEAFMDNVRNNFNNFHLEQIATMSEFEEHNFSNSEIAYKMGYAVNLVSAIDIDGGNVHTYEKYAGGFGIIELSELAAKLNMPRSALVENLITIGMPIEYVDDELDMGVVNPIYQSRDETTWYLETDKQFICYSDTYEDTYHYTDLMYVLESERQDMLENVKQVILAIAEIGTYNASINAITLNDEQAELLKETFDAEEISDVKLSIENNYPKQLSLTVDGAAAKFNINGINTTEVVVPNFIPNEPCIHDYHNHYYDELPNGKHQLYCASCYKYLAEPEDHALASNNDHVFCTKCQRILDLEYAPNQMMSLSDDTSYGAIYQSQTNNKLYFEAFYSTGDSHYLRYTNTFAAYYYSNSKTLVVFKAHPLNDKLLAQQNSYVSLGYSCFKAIQGVIEIFENITVTDYSFILGSLTDAQYQQVRVENEPTRHYDCYRVFREHNYAAEVSTTINSCTTLKTTTCQVCQAEGSRYAISNHAYDEVDIKRLNDCYSVYCEVCSKCGYESYEDRIEDHLNATYTLIVDDMYIKLKYGLTSLAGAYIEVNCPTCKREFLIEDKNAISCFHDTEQHLCTVYEYINNEVVSFEDGYVIYPHVLDEQHVCWMCGYIVIEVDGVALYFNYYTDLVDNLEGILLDSYYSAEIEIYSDFEEDIPNNKWEMKLYSDPAKTVLVASLEGDSENTYVIVKNSANEVVYEAHSGAPLPVVEQ